MKKLIYTIVYLCAMLYPAFGQELKIELELEKNEYLSRENIDCFLRIINNGGKEFNFENLKIDNKNGLYPIISTVDANEVKVAISSNNTTMRPYIISAGDTAYYILNDLSFSFANAYNRKLNSPYFENGAYRIKFKYSDSKNNVFYSNEVSFAVVKPQSITDINSLKEFDILLENSFNNKSSYKNILKNNKTKLLKIINKYPNTIYKNTFYSKLFLYTKMLSRKDLPAVLKNFIEEESGSYLALYYFYGARSKYTKPLLLDHTISTNLKKSNSYNKVKSILNFSDSKMKQHKINSYQKSRTYKNREQPK